MATTAILSQDCVEAFITRETEALAAEIFSTTYGLGWGAAWNQAIDLLPDLLTYAGDWDASAVPPIMLALEVDHVAR